MYFHVLGYLSSSDFQLNRLIMFIVMITTEWNAKIVNFMTPGAGVLVIGRGPIRHRENEFFLFFYSKAYM